MPEIDATVGGVAANAYVDVDGASTLMDQFPHGDDWERLDQTIQERLLIRGSQIIGRFKSWPPKQDSAQRLAFPTSKDEVGVLPEEVKQALGEYLEMVCAGTIDALKELQAEGVKSASVLGQNSSFDKDTSQLPVGARNELEGLWTRYNQPVGKNRPANRDRLACDIVQDQPSETTFGGDNSVFK